MRTILLTILLGLLPLQAVAMTITGKVLGPYANAVVCIDTDADLYCDSDFVESDASGAFSVEGDATAEALVLAKMTFESYRADAAGAVPVERALWFAAKTADADRLSARTSLHLAYTAAGLSPSEALEKLAEEYGVPVDAVLSDPAAIESEDVRARVIQAENDAAELIRQGLADWSVEDAVAVHLIELLTDAGDEPPPAQCDRLMVDPNTLYLHWFLPGEPYGVHLVIATNSLFPGDLMQSVWSGFRVISQQSVRCSDEYTTVSGRAMGAELFGGGELCLDATGDRSCADEASAYRATANAAGSYLLLNLPNELLDEHSLIAVSSLQPEVPLFTPGIMAKLNGGLAMLTPSISVIDQYSHLYNAKFAALYKDMLDEAYQFDPALNLSTIDYGETAHQSSPTLQALALYDELLISDPAYADFMSGTLFPVDWFTQVEDAFEAYSSEQWPEAVDIAELEAIFGEQIWYQGYFEETGTVFEATATSDNDPPLNKVETYKEVLDAADLSNGIRGAALEAVGAIPYVGAIANTILDLAWPEETGLKDLLGLLYQDVTRLIEHHLAGFVQNQYQTDLGTVRQAMAEFPSQQEPENQRQKFTTAFTRSDTILDRLWNDREYGHRAVPIYVQALLARMSLHRERLAHRELLAPDVSESAVLENFREDYKKYRDELFLGYQGKPSLMQRYLDWRFANIQVERGVVEGEWPWVYRFGKVEDRVSGYQIHFQLHTDDCVEVVQEDCFVGDVEQVANRLRNRARLDFAKIAAAAMLVPRLLPEDLLGADDIVEETERQGLQSYYVPRELKEIEVGPYSQFCMEYLSEYQGYSPTKPRCTGVIRDRSSSRTPYELAKGATAWFVSTRFELVSRTGDVLSWRLQNPAVLYEYEFAPPDSIYSVTGLGFDFRSYREYPGTPHDGALHRLRFVFQRRDPERPEHPVLYQPTVPANIPDGTGPVAPQPHWMADGSLDYRISGGATGLIREAEEGPFRAAPYLYLNYAFFPDDDRRAP